MVDVMTVAPEVRADIKEFSRAWWIFLVTGIAWLFVSVMVLQFDSQSVATISLLFAIVIFFAAVDELLLTFMSPGWKWLHAILAVVFLFGGVWALAFPGQTFGTLALLVAWFLMIRGTFETVASLMNRDVELWWLGLLAGLAQIFIAFWALGYPGRSAYLLVLWVGIAALFHGISSILLAFQIKSFGKAVSS
jgi:uncharacterized membrane protein HdeD (DUF308 family)